MKAWLRSLIGWPKSKPGRLRVPLLHPCSTPPEPKLGDRWRCPDCAAHWSASLHGFEEVAWRRSSPWRSSPYVD